ncbi:MAG: 2-oxoacid:ferredoxin oxidoreductase subunit gamma [Candidatus Bathyarchaeota archaeon]|nr:MAG: 2-oxoacid:ferredoxin oxidoreductase subunit gamma [Candidatus Bathyarchaeota archaeon]
MRTEIRFAGFGGQGIIRSGLITSMAACIYSDKNAVQTQSYGPESRGGSCKSEVVIADTQIDFPKVDDPDILIIMSQAAYHKYAGAVKNGTTILVDPDMVRDRSDPTNAKTYDIPATKIAQKLGKTIVANVIMLGALAALTNIVSRKAMKEAILQNIPKGTEELNAAAFRKGYDYGKQLLKIDNS